MQRNHTVDLRLTNAFIRWTSYKLWKLMVDCGVLTQVERPHWNWFLFKFFSILVPPRVEALLSQSKTKMKMNKPSDWMLVVFISDKSGEFTHVCICL